MAVVDREVVRIRWDVHSLFSLCFVVTNARIVKKQSCLLINMILLLLILLNIQVFSKQFMLLTRFLWSGGLFGSPETAALCELSTGIPDDRCPRASCQPTTKHQPFLCVNCHSDRVFSKLSVVTYFTGPLSRLAFCGSQCDAQCCTIIRSTSRSLLLAAPTRTQFFDCHDGDCPLC